MATATAQKGSGGRIARLKESSGRAARRVRDATLGGALSLGALAALAALVSYHPSDASLNTAAGDPTRNWLGPIGAWGADALLMLFGPPIGFVLPLLFLFGLRIARSAEPGRWIRSLVLTMIGIALIGAAAGLLVGGAVVGLPAGWGGAIGLALANLAQWGLSAIGNPAIVQPFRVALMALATAGGLALCLIGLGLTVEERSWIASRRLPKPAPREVTSAADPEVPSRPARAVVAPPQESRSPVIADRTAQPSVAKPKAKQASLDLRDDFQLPPLDLLTPAPPSPNAAIDKAALERNARLLESVLDDFNVKGAITEVRPGPVVTMYELEPAAGIKASRVIALADDIARNMSAISARVATIPGRSVIGIELPNARREGVSLHELVASQSFEDQSAQLPIILGKNIAGDPVIADLAPMPHLLIAGTTGSGKSVGLNCMILSLLYRLTPKQCKMIMIDPKMLELSMYEDIPHLLAPVVTEPAKAVRALKWAVEQMEDRYRMMASVGVRSLAGFNDKVRAAKAKGKPLGRKVQTGYHPETGQPVYEEEQLDYQPLEQIVVIVDELADLMMTAGK